MTQASTIVIDEHMEDRFINKPITVMHLIHTIGHGGIETAVISWLKTIDSSRYKIHLVCFENPGNSEEAFVEAAQRSGVTVSKIPWARYKPLIRSTRALLRLMREYDVDILHTHNFYAEVVGLFAARIAGAKLITTMYVWGEEGWPVAVFQMIQKYLFRLFDVVSAHCERTRIGSIDRGIDEKKSPLLICGFETHRVNLTADKRTQLRARRGISDDEIVLCNIARFYPVKRQDFLLHAFKKINERHPSTRLWIAGVGPLESELKALCTELGLDNKVDFLGFVSDLPELVAQVDIQVHPSYLEGVPLAICEGMASSLPIVVSDVGGLSEVIHNDKTGILVPPDDDEGFIQAVIDVVGDTDKQRRLGQAARHFIENDYSLETAVSHVETLYNQMMESG